MQQHSSHHQPEEDVRAVEGGDVCAAVSSDPSGIMWSSPPVRPPATQDEYVSKSAINPASYHHVCARPFLLASINRIANSAPVHSSYRLP
ncbi:hypothetical protein A0H81_09937 [Grifola frondosa]|uniref:Uncharacterized protein n=1 Tax=Grifola frondosa TaxID=5627 RepID=A0A1C7M4P8_GRIFR|nr:hypothetical protein A0H81_09937 [Grifola frondosa]